MDKYVLQIKNGVFTCIFIVLTVSSISWGEYSVDEIVQILQKRESIVRTTEYEITQIKHRTKEGTEVWEELKPNSLAKLDNPETPARRDIIRIRKGEKDYVRDIHYRIGMEDVAGEVLKTWNGSIGKRYISQSNTGRVEKDHFTVDEELPERAGLELMGKPLHEWLNETKTKVDETENGVKVEFEILQGLVVQYTLDPNKDFLPSNYKILKSGQIAYEMNISEISSYEVLGDKVYFPVKYNSITYISKALEPYQKGKTQKFQMIPFLKTKVEVRRVEFNKEIPDTQFDIKFPENAHIYDEFLGSILPTATNERILLEAIDGQIEEYSKKNGAAEKVASQQGNTKINTEGVKTKINQTDKRALGNVNNLANADNDSSNLKWLFISITFIVIAVIISFKYLKKGYLNNGK
ncbi:MAG: hypothetical protein DRP56_00635 [Planctomycetota bacterium]|nr:MAG: hypothetical protein DRP56_00635 [Planctomycetota bacterium]